MSQAFCRRCSLEVEPGALRCQHCGAPFQGPDQVPQIRVPPVRYGIESPATDPITGGLELAGNAITFGWPDDGDQAEEP